MPDENNIYVVDKNPMITSLAEFYKNNEGGARRIKEITACADVPAVLALLENNVEIRGRGASSKTYLNYHKEQIPVLLSKDRMEPGDESTVVKFLQVLYRENRGSKKRADEIFYKSPTEKTYYSIDEIIQNLFSRAIRDPKGASSTTLQSLRAITINSGFLDGKAQKLHEKLPAGSASDPAPGFFRPKALTRETLQAYCELKSIQLDVKPVVERSEALVM